MTTTPTGRRFAVVTGASSGIGYELARQFVEHGFDVLLAAENSDIERAAAGLQRDGGGSVQAVRVDLATYDGVEALYQAAVATGRPVDALALNAGRGRCGSDHPGHRHDRLAAGGSNGLAARRLDIATRALHT
jgi:short-subunit dehydrogenase